jgi:hypothetical protein
VLSQLSHLDITGPGLRWDCADEFQQQCDPLLAAWVRDYLEQVMVAPVSGGSCPMCEIAQGELMGHSYFQPPDHSRDHQIYLEPLENNDIDAQHTLEVCPNPNQFCQYPLRNVYRL